MSSSWEQRWPHQFLNEIVNSLTGLHKQYDPPGLLQLGDHLLQGVSTDHPGSLRLTGQEGIDFGDCPIKSADLKGQESWLDPWHTRPSHYGIRDNEISLRPKILGRLPLPSPFSTQVLMDHSEVKFRGWNGRELNLSKGQRPRHIGHESVTSWLELESRNQLVPDSYLLPLITLASMLV